MPTPWDAFYKEVLTQFFQKEQVSVNTQVEVGRLPRAIDIAVVCSQNQAQRLGSTSPFIFFRRYNLLEFKSPSDPLTVDEYKRIIARAYLYMADVSMDNLSLITVCAVTSGKPVKVLHEVPQLVGFSRISDALYKSDDKLPFYVLVVAELAIEERNYPLLLFSKGEKRKAFLRELVRKGATEYLRLTYELYPEDVTEVFSMSKDFPTLEENIQFIIKDLGAERILRAMRPEDVAEAIPGDQKKTLLRILLKQLSDDEVELILRDNGKRKS
ncbi:hypothetical protein FJZ31_15535 [Candidatus Poribacteria bacterium]|nr:hypothetical protein [Candidatus Poribacteria bacterium]